MIDALLNIVLVLAILVVLVVVHEFGHFITARMARVRVHEFGIGFPPRARILGRDHETVYTLNWLPIGGFVRLEGEEGESDDRRAFVNQRLPVRLVILLAGVFMNFVLAWLVFAIIALAGEPISAPRIAAVQPDSPAARAGLVGGREVSRDPQGNPVYDLSGSDQILAVDGNRYALYLSMTDVFDYMRERPGQTVTLTVRRADGTIEDKPVTLRSPSELTAERPVLGVTFRPAWHQVAYDLPTSLGLGLERTGQASVLILNGLRDLIANLTAPTVTGPVGIVQAVGVVRDEAAPPLAWLFLIGALSANLAVVNVLPIPPMDGGRIAMSLVQALSGNRISVAVERATYLAGFVLLFAFLIWVTWFDLQRAFGGGPTP